MYTVSGRRVMLRERREASCDVYRDFVFRGKDDLGGEMANGVYLFVIEVYEGRILLDRRAGKMVILK